VEEAINGISTWIDLGTLMHPAIVRLAPIFLGAPAWAQVEEHGPFNNWSKLKQAVEGEFGLSAVQERATFMSLTRREN
jgi:hypothetical protein